MHIYKYIYLVHYTLETRFDGQVFFGACAAANIIIVCSLPALPQQACQLFVSLLEKVANPRASAHGQSAYVLPYLVHGYHLPTLALPTAVQQWQMGNR